MTAGEAIIKSEELEMSGRAENGGRPQSRGRGHARSEGGRGRARRRMQKAWVAGIGHVLARLGVHGRLGPMGAARPPRQETAAPTDPHLQVPRSAGAHAGHAVGRLGHAAWPVVGRGRRCSRRPWRRRSLATPPGWSLSGFSDCLPACACGPFSDRGVGHGARLWDRSSLQLHCGSKYAS